MILKSISRQLLLLFAIATIGTALVVEDNDGASVAEACRRNPHLLVCQFTRNTTKQRIKRSDEEDKRSRQELIDKAACEILVPDHKKICVGNDIQALNETMKEFCEAFDNICSPFQKDQEIRSNAPTISGREGSNDHKQRDFTKFCAEFKQRYLYVCPDPLRFGKKAVVFCPLYAEKCQVPLPEKPVVATRRTRRLNARAAIARLCAENRDFALYSCYNPILLQHPNYRDACNKYRRFCTRAPPHPA